MNWSRASKVTGGSVGVCELALESAEGSWSGSLSPAGLLKLVTGNFQFRIFQTSHGLKLQTIYAQ